MHLRALLAFIFVSLAVLLGVRALGVGNIDVDACERSHQPGNGIYVPVFTEAIYYLSRDEGCVDAARASRWKRDINGLGALAAATAGAVSFVALVRSRGASGSSR